MPLSRLVAFVEDGPWCGTRIPGFHPPRPGHLGSAVAQALAGSLADTVSLNPQPLPPQGETAALLWQAVRLHQHGQQLNANKGTAEIGQLLMKSSQALFDDGESGSVPWQVLLRWLGHPPPPPPPWLDRLGHAVSQLTLGSRMGGDFGKQLQIAATQALQDQLASRQQA